MSARRFFKCLLVCSLAMLTLSTGASATSIFGEISNSPSQEAAVFAPSYGNVCGKEPDSVSKNMHGDTVLTYQNVTLEDFDHFGRYLNLLTYYVTEQKDDRDTHVFSVTDDTLSFSVEYMGKEEELQITYPEGTLYDDVFFPGCKRLFPGDTFFKDGIGDFTITGIKVSDQITEAYISRSRSANYTFPGVVLMIDYNNTSNEAHYLSYTRAASYNKMGLGFSDTIAFRAVSIDGKEENRYSLECAGKLTNSDRIVVNDDDKYRPHNTYSIAVGFEVPKLQVVNADHGCFAIVIGYCIRNSDDPEYVLVLSENGHRMY